MVISMEGRMNNNDELAARKSVIITGSNRGLGLEIARAACKENYFYYGISKWNDLDVSDCFSLTEFFSNLNETEHVLFPSAIINNAGICIPGNILEFKQDHFSSQFETNVLGVLNCSQLYTQLCIKNKIPGKIINIASTAGMSVRPGRSIYAATKAAVINLSLSMAQELKEYGIKVYCLCPGAFDSDLRRTIAPDDDFENMLKPEEIAKFIMDKIIKDEYNFLDNQVIYIRR